MSYNIMQHRLVGATNIGSTDYSALTITVGDITLKKFL
jgi:hypothetical protein